MQTKQCSSCKTNKPIEQFSRRTRNADGLNCQCKVCADSAPSRQREYREKYWREYYTPKLTSRSCEKCSGVYMPKHHAQKRCDECRTKACPQCGKQFIPPYGQHGQVCCSRRCAALNDPERTRRISEHRGKRPRTMTKSGNPKRGSAEDREWRTAIFKRDKYTCRKCKQVGGRLQAHHIKSVSRHPALRFTLSNGVTLCEKCHKKTDNYGSKARRERKPNRLRQEVLF